MTYEQIASLLVLLPFGAWIVVQAWKGRLR